MIKEYQFDCDPLEKIKLSRKNYPSIQPVSEENWMGIYHFNQTTIKATNNKIRIYTDIYSELFHKDDNESITMLEEMLGIEHIKEEVIERIQI